MSCLFDSVRRHSTWFYFQSISSSRDTQDILSCHDIVTLRWSSTIRTRFLWTSRSNIASSSNSGNTQRIGTTRTYRVNSSHDRISSIDDTSSLWHSRQLCRIDALSMWAAMSRWTCYPYRTIVNSDQSGSRTGTRKLFSCRTASNSKARYRRHKCCYSNILPTRYFSVPNKIKLTRWLILLLQLNSKIRPIRSLERNIRVAYAYRAFNHERGKKWVIVS